MAQKRKNGTPKIGTLTATSKAVLQELISSPHGLRAATIAKILSKPRRTIYNNLKKLEQADLVKNVYPIWMIAKTQSESLNLAHLLQKSKIQLHNVSFVLRLLDTPHWWKRRNNKLLKLKEMQVRAIKWGNNPYTQIIKDNFIIQLFSNSIIFISRKHYWGEDSYDCFIQATNDFLDLYTYIEQRFNFKFFKDEVPQVMVRSQHYVRLRDALAKKCKKTKAGFEVVVDGKLRLWVDMSEPLGVEAGHKDYAPEDMRLYQKYVEDVITKNPPKPSEFEQRMGLLLDAAGRNARSINGLINKQERHEATMDHLDKNFETHFSVLKGIEGQVSNLGAAVTKLMETISRMQKERTKSQDKDKK